VLLTVQVDSVGKSDRVIPPNVRHAANLHQKNDIFVRGEPAIAAEDPAATSGLGNYEYDYARKPIDLSGVPWHTRIFRVAHSKMDRDPDVWRKIRTLILSRVPSP